MPKTCQTNLMTVIEVSCVTVKAGRHSDYHSRQSTGPSSPTVCYHRIIISSLLEGQQDARDLVTWEGSEQAQQRLCLQWTPFVGKVEIFVLVSTTKEQIVVCNHTDRQETKSYLVFPSTHTKGLHAVSTVIGNSRLQLNRCLTVLIKRKHPAQLYWSSCSVSWCNVVYGLVYFKICCQIKRKATTLLCSPWIHEPQPVRAITGRWRRNKVNRQRILEYSISAWKQRCLVDANMMSTMTNRHRD